MTIGARGGPGRPRAPAASLEDRAMRPTILCAAAAAASLACAAAARAAEIPAPAPASADDPAAAASPCQAPPAAAPLGEDLRLIHVCPTPPGGERPPAL